MAQPTSSDVHVDAVLTNISIAYMQAQDNFIASKVFPVVPVSKQSDKYFTYTKEDFLRDEAQKRADTDQSVGSGYDVSTTAYYCDVWALHKDIGPQTLANADPPLDPEGDAARFLTQRMLLRQEVQWVSDSFSTSIWGTDKTGGTNFDQWNEDTSDPIEDIEAGKSTILQNTGIMPNKLVVGYQVFRQLKQHPDIVDRFKYTTANTVTADLLARFFDLEEVIVAKAVNATNVEDETAVYAFTHGKHALLCYSAPTPSLMTPSAGYTFMWNGVSNGLGESIGTSRMDIPLVQGAIRIESQVAFDNKIIATDLGYFFSGAVA